MEHFGLGIAQGSANADTTEINDHTISKYRKLRSVVKPISLFLSENQTSPEESEGYTMDLSTEKIVVLDLDEQRPIGIKNALSSQVRFRYK